MRERHFAFNFCHCLRHHCHRSDHRDRSRQPLADYWKQYAKFNLLVWRPTHHFYYFRWEYLHICQTKAHCDGGAAYLSGVESLASNDLPDSSKCRFDCLQQTYDIHLRPSWLGGEGKKKRRRRRRLYLVDVVVIAIRLHIHTQPTSRQHNIGRLCS